MGGLERELKRLLNEYDMGKERQGGKGELKRAVFDSLALPLIFDK